jgi:hypothetical protein
VLTIVSALQQFDIFRTDADGNLLWLEAAADLRSAEARIRTIGHLQPGEYLILDQRTGNKIPVKVGTNRGSNSAGCNGVGSNQPGET